MNYFQNGNHTIYSYSAKVENTWIYTSTPPYDFMA
jgi:hypothetical protein